jgi:hypothetical protein
VVPLSAERVLLKITIHRSTHDKMLHAQNLLGHQLPSGALEQVLDRAIDALIEKLEKRKYGATDQPRKSARASVNPRSISAQVKRAVRERDRDRCTFVAQDGHRCEARKFLEFDHALPVARGGQSTIGNLRLRCRAHNQYAAEQDYGSAFMERSGPKRSVREARRRERSGPGSPERKPRNSCPGSRPSGFVPITRAKRPRVAPTCQVQHWKSG